MLPEGLMVQGVELNASELQRVEGLAKVTELCLGIYRISSKFPKEEIYGLTS
jgi:hypothetical protein